MEKMAHEIIKDTDLSADLIIGIDAGTSVMKTVAFTLDGQQVASASIRNSYQSGVNGSVTQSLSATWHDCTKALKQLALKIDNLAKRTISIAVTGQGDGTWLIDNKGEPVGDAWLWLDARAAPTVDVLNGFDSERMRFEATGTGLNTCQQSAQMSHMKLYYPELLDRAATAFHCKDWLYYKLTNIRATDPSECSFTFGNFRTRQYDKDVILALGLQDYRHLMPDVIEGTEQHHALSDEAAQQCGLCAGTPVVLGYVDMVMTALGAGVRSGGINSACSAIGSTGVHLKAKSVDDVVLNEQRTGYVIALPIPNIVTQVQTNMGATINLDWLLQMAADLMAEFGLTVSHTDMLSKIDRWFYDSPPGHIIYHPYISEAGERGPFVNANARASFNGLAARHRFPDLVRAVIEGLGLAMRDCYACMGSLPHELRLSGGAVRSKALRGSLAAALNTSVQVSLREEAGAAGASMMAAVALGVYKNMDACIADWVTPFLGQAEQADEIDVARYNQLYRAYSDLRQAILPTWSMLAEH